MKPDTVWRRGSHVLFGQMYEDVDIEMQVFPAGSRVFTIASAGCSAISLSRIHEVTAVDINPVQLEYARQRAAGGPTCAGRAERVMQLGRFTMRVAGWKPALLERFCQFSDCRAQCEFWKEKLDGPVFRALFDASISAALFSLRRLAPERVFLPTEKFGPMLRKRLERSFARYPNSGNPYAQQLLGGRMATDLCCAVKPIRFIHADAAEFLEQCKAGSFDAFSLSNIADGVTRQYWRRLAAAVAHAASTGAVAVLRSFRDTGSRAESEMAAEDRSMIWGSVYRGPAQRLNDALPA